MYDVLQNFKTLDKDSGKWVFPLSSFINGRWVFVSQKSGKHFQVEDLFLESFNPKMNDLFRSYKDNAVMAAAIWTSPEFVCYWLSQMVYTNALYYADAARVKFLEENLTDDLDKKKVGKVHKQSEVEGEKAFDFYMKIYEKE